MPRSKKEKNVEEAKIQNKKNILETEKVVNKKSLLEKKAKKVTKIISENSGAEVNTSSKKPKLKAIKKSIVDFEIVKNNNIDIRDNLPVSKNKIVVEKPKNNKKKSNKKEITENQLKVNDNLIESTTLQTQENSDKELISKNDEINIDIVEDKPQGEDTKPNSDSIKSDFKLENKDIKFGKKFGKNQNLKLKKIIPPVEIKIDKQDDATSTVIDNDIEFIKTENKYYNFQSKQQKKSKKISENTIEDILIESQDINIKVPEILNIEPEIVNDIPEIIELLENIESPKTDLSETKKEFVAESSKPEKKNLKAHEEKLRDKNERIEQARILNRMNQLRLNEERRLLKLQSQGKPFPENAIEIDKKKDEIPTLKSDENFIVNPEPKVTEKIKTEKPLPKTEEEKLREKNERIEQARILNRMNQLQRNKEKQLLRQQEALNKLNEQKVIPPTTVQANQPILEEFVKIPESGTDDKPAQEIITQSLNEIKGQFPVKESFEEQSSEISIETEKENIKKELQSKVKDIKSKPDHSKKSPKIPVEKSFDEIKTKKPIPDLILDYTILNPKRLLTNTQKNDPFLQKFYDKVEEFLKKELFIEKGSKILVAVSGGVDSIVLLDCLAILSNKLFFNVYIAHYNHKLRGESSEKDEKFVSGLAQDYNLQFYLATGNVKSFAEKNSISIEHAARQLRYNFFERTARNLNIDFVATAHTADDSAETFLINLIRGSGLTGLSGIPAKRQFVKNISIVRPLLGFHKNELLEYTKKRKLVWRQDESNALMNYTRNKIRLDLLPKLETEYNPSIIDTINRTSRLIFGADEIVKDIVKKNITNLIVEAGADKFSMKISMLQTFSEFLQGEFIQYSWLKYFRLQPLSLATIDRILNLFNSQTGAVCEINSQFFALKDRNNLIFSKKNIEEGFKQLVTVPGEIIIGKQKIVFKEIDRTDLKYNADTNIEYFDGKAFEGFIELRTWAEGDSFQPLGMTGEIKLSDFLINEKVSLIDKSKILVLTNKVEIIWVVGKRISEKFKVKKTSKTIIKAEIIKTDKK